MLRQAKITYFSWTTPIYIVLGFLIVFFFETTPISTVTADEGADWYTYLMLVIAGFIAAIALVLPA